MIDELEIIWKKMVVDEIKDYPGIIPKEVRKHGESE
jgi:hypothetical protein